MADDVHPDLQETGKAGDGPAQAVPPGRAASARPDRVISVPEDEFEEYLSYKVAESAKKKVFAYFAVLGLVVSVVVTFFGMDRVWNLIDERYRARVEEQEREASARVESLAKEFESKLAALQGRAETRAREYHLKMDASFQSLSGKSAAQVKLSVDFSGDVGPIGDQGEEGTTVGFAVAYALSAAHKRLTGEEMIFSARSIYVEAKRHDEWTGENYEGTSVSGGMRGLVEVGAYLESDWPYEALSASPDKKPIQKISSFRELPTDRIDEIVEALNNGMPVVASLSVTQDFQNVGEDGRISIADPQDVMGGQAVCIVGYEGATDEFKFANSWGTEWGDGGFGYIGRADLAKILIHAATLSL